MDLKNFKKNLGTTRGFYSLIFWYIIILLLCFFVSVLVLRNLWTEHTAVVHTVFELVCIFISLGIFTVVWYTHKTNPKYLTILGFGFLSVAIFDILHTLFYPLLNLYPQNHYDISTKFWILARLAEAITIFLSASAIFKKRVNKWLSLLIVLVSTIVPAFLVIRFNYLLPVFLDQNGITSIKRLLEYLIIFIHIINLLLLVNRINSKDMLFYKYIRLGIFLIIPVELLFSIYSKVDSEAMVFGSLLKIVYYLLFFKGILASCLYYPYDKLEESTIQLTNIFNELPEGIIVFNHDKRVSFVNRAGESILKYNKNKLLNLSIKEINNLFKQEFGNHQGLFYHGEHENSRNSTVETRSFVDIDGNTVQLHINHYHTQMGLLVLFYDVKRDEELKHLQFQTQLILNSINNIILMLDAKNKVIMCNSYFEKLLETPSSKVINMKLSQLYKMFHVEIDTESSRHSLKNQSGIDIYVTTPKGSKRNLLIHTAPITNIQKETIGRILIASDITNWKSQQEKIRQQEKLALLGQLGASIVHETRNYLTTIKGNSQLLKLVADNAKTKNIVDNICKETDEVNRIISDFLTMSKPNPLVLKETCLKKLMGSMEGILKTSSLIKGVDIKIYQTNDEYPLRCDESQIRQVILNMVKNAVEAMTHVKNPIVTIITGYDINKNMAYIKISDTGKGMSPEELKKIRTPFFTTKSNGTGLGLNVCYQIIEKHNGYIDVKSEPDKGTTFTIHLPIFNNETDTG